jgi:hypothetical protein
MDWRNRLPRTARSQLSDNLFEILRMSLEEYRREMRAQGFGEGFTDQDLADLERARAAPVGPGPAAPRTRGISVLARPGSVCR